MMAVEKQDTDRSLQVARKQPVTVDARQKMSRLLQRGLRLVWFVLGREMSLQTEDRRVLEQIILSEYASRSNVHRVLFVGVDWYTKHYETAFRGREYCTIDRVPRQRWFGAQRHVVGTMEEMDGFFPSSYFDLIICNGVFGWGLDSREGCERAFSNAYALLRPGGEVIIGWADIPERTPVALGSLESLARFDRVEFPTLNAVDFLTDTPYRHTYSFYRKPGRSPRCDLPSTCKSPSVHPLVGVAMAVLASFDVCEANIVEVGFDRHLARAKLIGAQ